MVLHFRSSCFQILTLQNFCWYFFAVLMFPEHAIVNKTELYFWAEDGLMSILLHHVSQNADQLFHICRVEDENFRVISITTFLYVVQGDRQKRVQLSDRVLFRSSLFFFTRISEVLVILRAYKGLLLNKLAHRGLQIAAQAWKYSGCNSIKDIRPFHVIRKFHFDLFLADSSSCFPSLASFVSTSCHW